MLKTDGRKENFNGKSCFESEGKREKLAKGTN